MSFAAVCRCKGTVLGLVSDAGGQDELTASTSMWSEGALEREEEVEWEEPVGEGDRAEAEEVGVREGMVEEGEVGREAAN